jgi:hypothetical protein
MKKSKKSKKPRKKKEKKLILKENGVEWFNKKFERLVEDLERSAKELYILRKMLFEDFVEKV